MKQPVPEICTDLVKTSAAVGWCRPSSWLALDLACMLHEHWLGLLRCHIHLHMHMFKCSVHAAVQAVAAPPAPAPRNLVSNVSEVGIRDAPLKPLFPDEPPPPKEVSDLAKSISNPSMT